MLELKDEGKSLVRLGRIETIRKTRRNTSCNIETENTDFGFRIYFYNRNDYVEYDYGMGQEAFELRNADMAHIFDIMSTEYSD